MFWIIYTGSKAPQSDNDGVKLSFLKKNLSLFPLFQEDRINPSKYGNLKKYGSLCIK
jgi:hypothetical protein